MRCIIQPDSRLDRCAVVSETPPGIGFGSAALTLAPFYRFQPPTENGEIQPNQAVTVTIPFGP
jgi:protein TonB